MFFYVFLYVVYMTKRTPQLFVFIVLLQYSRTGVPLISKKNSKYIIIWWQAMCICKTYNITIAEVIEFFAFKLVCYVFCCFVCCILNLILILKINHTDEATDKKKRENENRQHNENLLEKTVHNWSWMIFR